MRATPLTALALFLAACTGSANETGTTPTDADGDGFTADVDCDDHDANVFPGAPEVCNGVDDDCDGEIDVGALDASAWYADADGDGYGDASASITACEAPSGYVANDADCNDDDARFHPGAPETDCSDPTDYNCDGSVGFADGDGDGFPACEDCDDANADVFPGAPERCNGVDDDCDGTIDVDAIDAPTFYADADADGHGDPSAATQACEAPEGTVSDDTDCDDTRDDIHPGAAEACDDIDRDCDGDTRDPESVDAVIWYIDADADGYGAADVDGGEGPYCDAPSENHSASNDDCDDTSASVYPGADEYCDDIDRDCDGDTRDPESLDAATFYADADADGYGTDETAVACDAPDGFATQAGDCDDTAPGINPSADERCDDVDHDCDGDPTAGAIDGITQYTDADGDGFGLASSEFMACALEPGASETPGDCDDDDAAIKPGALERCDGADNDCDGLTDGVDAWFDPAFPYRIPVTLTASGRDVDGPPVALDVDFRAALDAVGDTSAFRPETLRVVVQDCAVGQPELPSQFDDGLANLLAKAPSDAPIGDGAGLVAFLYDLDGDYGTLDTFAASSTAEIALYFASEDTVGDLTAPSYATDLFVAEGELTNARSTALFDPSRGGMMSSLTLPDGASLINQASSCCGNGLIAGTAGWTADPQDGPGDLAVLSAGPALSVLEATGDRAGGWGAYTYSFKYFQFAGRPEVYIKVWEATTRDTTINHPGDAVSGIRPFEARSNLLPGGTVDVAEDLSYLHMANSVGGLGLGILEPPTYLTRLGHSADYVLLVGNDFVESAPATGAGLAALKIPNDTVFIDDVVMVLLPHGGDHASIEGALTGLIEGVGASQGAPEAW